MTDTLTAPRNLLEALADGDDCDFDHHGGCQAHGYLSLEPGELCPQRELKDLLAAPDPTAPRARRIATPGEARDLLTRDLLDIDGIVMGTPGEDQDALLALTADWQAVAGRLPALAVKECLPANAVFRPTGESVIWARLAVFPDASGDLGDPDWGIETIVVFDGGGHRPIGPDDEGAFQCVLAHAEWAAVTR